MAVRRAKGVSERANEADAVVATAFAHAPQVAAGLVAAFTPVLEEGESLPDLAPLIVWCGRLVEVGRERMVEADAAHILEQVDDDDSRLRRDDAVGDLYGKMTETRGMASGLFGAQRGDLLLALQGDTPQVPKELLRQARVTQAHLFEPTIEVPAVRSPAVQVDTTAWATELEPYIDAVAEALADVDRERREAETTLVEKLRAMADYDDLSSAAAKVLEGVFELAGYPELADRVRPATRRRRRPEVDPPQEQEGASRPPIPVAVPVAPPEEVAEDADG